MPNPKLLQFAKNLRTHSTDAEQILWYQLRSHRFYNFKFKRQQPLGRYIADFVCFKAKLVIELDGGQHALEAYYDDARSRWLRARGFEIIRFWNNEITENLEGVLMIIAEKLGKV